VDHRPSGRIETRAWFTDFENRQAAHLHDFMEAEIVCCGRRSVKVDSAAEEVWKNSWFLGYASMLDELQRRTFVYIAREFGCEIKRPSSSGSQNCSFEVFVNVPRVLKPNTAQAFQKSGGRGGRRRGRGGGGTTSVIRIRTGNVLTQRAPCMSTF
jgi:hypothetical protein